LFVNICNYELCKNIYEEYRSVVNLLHQEGECHVDQQAAVQFTSGDGYWVLDVAIYVVCDAVAQHWVGRWFLGHLAAEFRGWVCGFDTDRFGDRAAV
jgi:hypothetical protein